MMLHFLFNYSTVVIGDLELYEVPEAAWNELKAAARKIVAKGQGSSWMHQGGELFKLWGLKVLCCSACGYHRAHEWNPFSESWNCRVCGQPWHDQSDWFDELDCTRPDDRRRR